MLGISSYRGSLPDRVTVRIAGGQAAGEAASVVRSSRCLLGKVIEKRLSFFSRQELEETQDRLQQDLRIAVFKVGTRHKISTNHF